jgi:Rnl2 family RNA ligase
MASHVKYHKIPYSISSDNHKHKKLRWCVTEKVHGANFSIYVQRSGAMKCAKRNGFLSDNDNFFGYFEPIERTRSLIWSLAEEIFTTAPDLDQFVLFGELFGGYYPGLSDPDNLSAVQVGVWYSPRVEFMVFDICHLMKVQSSDNTTIPRMHYLPYANVISLCEKHSLLYARPLFIGSLHEACAYPLRFSTTLPSLLGVTSPSSGSLSTAEGIVIREIDQPYPCGAEGRPIFKIKCEEFSEGEGCPPSGHSDEKAIHDWILSLINANRLASASSKIGDPRDRRNWNAIVDCVVFDVEEECGIGMIGVVGQLHPQIRYKSYNMLADGGAG